MESELSLRLSGIADQTLRALRRRRVGVALTAYTVAAAVSYAGAFWLRFEFVWPGDMVGVFWSTLPFLLLLRLGVGWWMGLATARWRFIGIHDVVKLVMATTLGSGLFLVLTGGFGFPARVPRSVVAIEWVLTTYGIGGMWLAYRWLFQKLRRNGGGIEGAPPKKVLVVGAGEAGAMLVREMLRYPTGYRPVGFVDDDPMKWGSTIDGIEVIGAVRDVAPIAAATGAEELFIAVPSASRDQLNAIVDRCMETELGFKILPGIAEVLRGEGFLQQLRPVEIEDLLGRPPVSLELPELAEAFRNQCVLITGAAGSIGSELSYQIALHSPRTLVLLDQAETPLVELDLRLRERFPAQRIVPVVGDITHRPTVERVFAEFRPDQVFHAAAYKHVPMMEVNAAEALRNNVIGTWLVAERAGLAGSRKFILVSTDKAVRPTSVMGATKRMAELLILEMQEAYPGTLFGAVRFGNVLGSNGSVVPLFRKQIAAGKPLTITHPEMARFFMTISEAVQLVLQASLLSDIRGRVAVLDMGEPVRIVDLAKQMLRLSGRPSRIGREIVFSGLRPGEKLEEELIGPGEEVLETAVSRVKIISTGRRVATGLRERIAALESGAHEAEGDMRVLLAEHLHEMPSKTRSKGAAVF